MRPDFTKPRLCIMWCVLLHHLVVVERTSKECVWFDNCITIYAVKLEFQSNVSFKLTELIWVLDTLCHQTMVQYGTTLVLREICKTKPNHQIIVVSFFLFLLMWFRDQRLQFITVPVTCPGISMLSLHFSSTILSTGQGCQGVTFKRLIGL